MTNKRKATNDDDAPQQPLKRTGTDLLCNYRHNEIYKNIIEYRNKDRKKNKKYLLYMNISTNI